MLAAAVVLFVAITIARLLITTPGWGIILLYDLPVALVAVAFGLRAGLGAALAAFGLFVLVDLTRPLSVGGVEIHQNLAGYSSRAAVFLLLGGVLGAFADRLRSTERLLSGVLGATHDPIVSADAEGRIVAFNRAAEETFGYSAADTVGQPLTVLMPERFREAHRAGLRRYLETRQPHVIGEAVELGALRADGTEFPMELSLTTFDLRGRPFFTGVVADITERKRAERERAAHQADLERSNVELEQFASIASHDLQEPLRTVSGFVELLAERYSGRLDDEAEQSIGFITDGVARMQALIDGLLAYARAGRTGLARERVALQEVVDRAVTSLEAARVQAAAEIHVGELPTVTGDASALGRVFQNLIGNALKFNDAEVPRVDVTAQPDEGGWIVSVQDNGIGIRPEDAERVFEMFQRLHGGSEYEGTGIGLAVTKTVIERHGGRIWCEAPPSGKGTVVRVFLPAAPGTRLS